MNPSSSAAIHPAEIVAHVGGTWLSVKVDPYYDPWYRFSRILRVVEALGKPSTGSTWLDVGCHQGQFLRVLADRYGIRGCGIDAWPVESKTDSAWDYVQRDIEAGFGVSETFDAISALEVIEHITDTDAFLEECRTHLRIGGQLVLSTPNINCLRNRVMVPLGRYPGGLEYRNVIHHVRLYNPACLRAQLEQHGFEVVRIEGVSLLPVRLLKWPVWRSVSESGARHLPQLCANIIAVSRRVD